MPQPLTSIPISTLNLPARMRVVDVQRSLRASGYQLCIERGRLVAVRIH